MKKIMIAIAGAIVVGAWLSHERQADMAEERAQQAEYCEMVRLWHLDEQAGIAPASRAGWPPFRGECTPGGSSKDR
jgi:hypothetical protein